MRPVTPPGNSRKISRATRQTTNLEKRNAPAAEAAAGGGWEPLIEVAYSAGNPFSSNYDNGSGSSYVAGHLYVQWDDVNYFSEDENFDARIAPLTANKEYLFFPIPTVAPTRSLYRFVFSIQGAWQWTTTPQHYDLNWFFYRGNVDHTTRTLSGSWSSQFVSRLVQETTFDDPLVTSGDYGSDGTKTASCIVRCSPSPATSHMAVRVQLMQELLGENAFKNSGLAAEMLVERLLPVSP